MCNFYFKDFKTTELHTSRIAHDERVEAINQDNNPT